MRVKVLFYQFSLEFSIEISIDFLGISLEKSIEFHFFCHLKNRLNFATFQVAIENFKCDCFFSIEDALGTLW